MCHTEHMHTMKTIRTAAIITMGLAGSGAVLAIIITATNMLTLQARYVSDVLPAGQTVLLIHRPLEQNLAPLAAWFSPETLEHLPSGTEGLALLRTEEGVIGAAVLVRSRTQGSGTIVAAPPFTVYTSDEAIAQILQDTYAPLTRNGAYSALRAGKKPDTPWAYMDTAWLMQQKQQAVPGLTTAVFGSGSHIGIEQRAESIIVQIAGAPPAPQKHSAPMQRGACHGAICVHGNVAWAWDSVQAHLSGEEAGIAHSIVTQWLIQAFGDGISWTYEVLPLLTQGSVQVGLPASGSLLTIEGTAPSEKAAEALAGRLHQRHAERYTPTEVRSTLLEDRFPSRDIRMAEKQEPTVQHVNGWRIQQSGGGTTDALLITAVHGSSIILSQDPALPAVLAAAARDTPPARMHLAGHIHQAALAALIEPYGIENLHDWLYVPVPPLGQEFAWELEQRGDMRIVRIGKQ